MRYCNVDNDIISDEKNNLSAEPVNMCTKKIIFFRLKMCGMFLFAIANEIKDSRESLAHWLF